jgi:retron-type reverse transcriptase
MERKIRRTLVNTDAPWPGLDEAESRVLKIQTKLHQWAVDDPNRRFFDLYNLVYDPAFLTVAWNRVKGNRGARSAGVDGVKPAPSSSATGCLPGFELSSRPARSSPCLCGSG